MMAITETIIIKITIKIIIGKIIMADMVIITIGKNIITIKETIIIIDETITIIIIIEETIIIIIIDKGIMEAIIVDIISFNNKQQDCSSYFLFYYY